MGFILFFSSFSSLSFSQGVFAFDQTTIETIVSGHEDARSYLSTRAEIEVINDYLHEVLRDSTNSYQDFHNKLDKYNHCFDLIDALLSGASLVFHISNVYSDVSSDLKGIAECLTAFGEFVVTEVDIRDSDRMIIDIGDDLLKGLQHEVGELKTCFYDLALYVTGVSSCSTSQLVVILNQIHDGLTHIRDLIRNAYHMLYNHVVLRMAYRSSPLDLPYIRKGKVVCANDAFSRWRESAIARITKK